MIKTTISECKQQARFTDFRTLKNYLKENQMVVTNVEKIAWTQGIYGCNGYLLRLETENNMVIYAFTNRSTWMYNCESLEQYND